MSKATKRSDTVPEMFFHIRSSTGDFIGTVFLRRHPKMGWVGSAALKHSKDNFSRSIGRNVARRRYFNPNVASRFSFYGSESVAKPTYGNAVDVYYQAVDIFLARESKAA